MDCIIDRMFIFLLSSLALVFIVPKCFFLQPLLCAIIISSLYIIFEKNTVIKGILFVISCVLICIVPMLGYFTGNFLYDYIKDKRKIYAIILSVISMVISAQINIESLIIIPLIGALSIWMEYQNENKNSYIDKLIETRDTGVELTDALKNKNKALIEKQEYEVYAATLKERNRIAREIHDSVGHVISRSILQVGALMAIHKGEKVNEELEQVKSTLDIAMNSIRSSVHDLHEASIDLENGVRKAADTLDGFEVSMCYDVGSEINNRFRHCILAIVQEAVSNINKHSNGDKVWIEINEQPAFYQCIIKDNGSKSNSKTMPGIGLENMTTRVQNLKGNINITNDDGFKIFVSLPKDFSSKGDM